MQKIKINSLQGEDLNFFNWYSDHFEIQQHSTVGELLSSGGIVLLTGNILKKYGVPSDNNMYILSMLQEGTNTVLDTLNGYGWKDQKNWPFILSSGDLPETIDHFNVDMFKFTLGITTDTLNQRDSEICNKIFEKKKKPFLFNFLNGVNRPHRSSMVEKLNNRGLLEKSLWSALYDNKFLPDSYCHQFNKDTIINGRYIFDDWPAGKLFSNIFEDSYFSLVTETNFYIPYSFRTEKIYKPIKVGHPFVAVANYGFYRDLHNLGFKTFNHLIDESFDLIDNHDDRLNRIVDVVEALCNSNLQEFVDAAEQNCRHNRELLMSTKHPEEDTSIVNKFLMKFEQYAKNKQ
jgi:hypothetical protein